MKPGEKTEINMTNRRTIVVLNNAGTYYFNTASSNLSGSKGILVNGKEPSPCTGENAYTYSAKWVKWRKPIKKVELVLPQSRKLVAFMLKEQYRGVVSLEPELPSDRLRASYDACEGENGEFYAPVYEEQPDRIEPMDVEIIDVEAEPRAIPDYVTPKFPADVEYPKYLWHHYPCSINYKKVFDLAYDELVAFCRGKAHLRVSGYKNIQSLTIYEVIQVESRKPYEISVLRLVGDYQESGATRTPNIEGDNFDAVKRKLAEYVESLKTSVDKQQYRVVKVSDPR